MYVKELWRYPVKSMAGEPIEETAVGELGVAGDRLVQVYDGGRVATARSYPRLLALHGSLGGKDGTGGGGAGERDGKRAGERKAEDGGDAPFIDGIPWSAPGALALARGAVGPRAMLLRGEAEARFDVLPLSVATDGAIDFMQIDGRRLRPNFVLGGVGGLAERTWPGRRLKIGSLVIHAHRLRPRCVMTTWDPDTQEQDISVLRRIGQTLQGAMSLDCSVVEPGVVRLGDRVCLL
jgi:hypothetical protein